MALLDTLFNQMAPGQGGEAQVSAPPAVQFQPTPTQQAPVEQQSKPRSGIMGVVNGVLETLGDIALVQSGLKPYFGPAHEQRRLSDAMSSLQDDTQGTIAKVAKIDPDRATKMQDDWIKTNISLRGADRQEALAKAQLENEKGKSYSVMGAMAGSMTPENYKQMVPILQRYAAKSGVEIPAAPAEYDKAFADSVRTLGTPAYQQQRLEDYDETAEDTKKYREASLKQRTDIADANRASADARAAATRAAADRRAAATEKGRMTRASMPARPRASGGGYQLPAVPKDLFKK